MLHSLVRVSRRVRWDRLGASDLNAHRDCTATPTSRSAGTASSPHRSDAVMAAVRPCGLRCSGEGRHSPRLRCVAPRGPEPRPEGLGHLPHRAPGAPSMHNPRDPPLEVVNGSVQPHGHSKHHTNSVVLTKRLWPQGPRPRLFADVTCEMARTL